MRESLKTNLPRCALYGLFGSWFAATLISQDPLRRFKGAHKLDKGGAFIPDWRFFAPRPGTHDYHLLARDELSDGSVTEWKEVGQTDQRRVSHLIWHPTLRAEKVLMDAVSGLIIFDQKTEARKEQVQVTIPYLTALNFVTYQAKHHPDTKRVQFLIAASSGYDESEEPLMLFLSNLHPLDLAR